MSNAICPFLNLLTFPSIPFSRKNPLASATFTAPDMAPAPEENHNGFCAAGAGAMGNPTLNIRVKKQAINLSTDNLLFNFYEYMVAFSGTTASSGLKPMRFL
ncbi:MAG: hypothetical protein V6Z89_17935 [Desulfobacter sp.]